VHLPQQALIALVRFYRFFLSPWLGSACRFEPTCSRYALEALERHGAVAGTLLTGHRLLRCHPWCAGGHDPVPAAAPRLFTSLLRKPPVRPADPADPAAPTSTSP
jgi:putative membrane protein insertion efficiency factor